MIAVDTSALMAILLDEPEAEACRAVISAEGALLISAATVAEALIVSARRNIGEEMERLLDGLGFEIVPVTPASARGVARAYASWRKGMHRAALNSGDCFSSDLAKSRGCPLLCVGDDFRRTDVEGVP